MPRLFIALPLDDRTLKRNSIEFVHSYFKKYENELKVVSPENYHITLKFLGDCSDKTTKRIEEDFDNITEIRKKLQYTLSGLGVFPDLKRPNVLWAGVRTDETLINKLMADIESFSNNLGFKKEKNQFLPHLTLARVRKGKNINEKIRQFIVENKELFLYESVFNKLVLFESKLNKESPEYTEIRSIQLDIEHQQVS